MNESNQARPELLVDENNYYKLLGYAQNEERNVHSDIMTFTGFMSWGEKLKHLQHYMPSFEIIDNH